MTGTEYDLGLWDGSIIWCQAVKLTHAIAAQASGSPGRNLPVCTVQCVNAVWVIVLRGVYAI